MLTFVLLICFANLGVVMADEILTPSEVLKAVYQNNPEIAAIKAQAAAERELISSQYSLSSPMIGFMKETDMNFMQMEDGPMKTWSVSQEFLFPTKYWSRGRIQRARATRGTHQHMFKKLDVRAKALTNYFRYFSARRILGLLEAQKETLREIARIAETKRAAGTVPQQDEMKAHVELTKIENELLLQKQEELEAKFTLNATLNRSVETNISLPATNFNAREMKVSELGSLGTTNSFEIKGMTESLQEAVLQKGLAKMGYLPDFRLSYQQVFGGNHPSSGRAIGIEMSVPLWFFAKENSELNSAVAQEYAARKELEEQKRSTEAMLQTLKTKVKTLSKLLEIYETSLIPQATSSLNSSRSAYSAGRVGFQELLDAERTLYSTRIEYFQNFSRLIEAVTSLEREAGMSVSSLPFEEEQM